MGSTQFRSFIPLTLAVALLGCDGRAVDSCGSDCAPAEAPLVGEAAQEGAAGTQAGLHHGRPVDYVLVLTSLGIRKVWFDEEGNVVEERREDDAPVVALAPPSIRRVRAAAGERPAAAEAITRRSREEGRRLARERAQVVGLPQLLGELSTATGRDVAAGSAALDPRSREALDAITAAAGPSEEVAGLLPWRDATPQTIPAPPVVVATQAGSPAASAAARLGGRRYRAIDVDRGLPGWVASEREELQLALRNRLGDLVLCLDEEQRLRGGAPLQVKLRFVVTSSGQVDAGIDRSTPVKPVVRECIARTAHGWDIGAPKYGPVVARYRVTARTVEIAPTVAGREAPVALHSL